MNQQYPKKKGLISISKTAEILDVSLDTIRRWDKVGILHSSRPSGKTRFFSLEAVEKLKFSKPMSISEISEKLKISPSTLRRLEKKNFVTPIRNNNGERLYTKESVTKFLDSEYFLRQRVVEDNVLEPIAPNDTNTKNNKTKEDLDPTLEAEHKVLTVSTHVNEQEIGKLNRFQKSFYASGILLWTLFVTLTLAITFLYILYPDSTARFFGLRYVGSERALLSNEQVLGVSYSSEPLNEASSSLGELLQPLNKVSLGVLGVVNPDLRQNIQTYAKDETESFFSLNEEGELETPYALKFLSSSRIKIPDNDIVNNLNSDYLRGKVPGSNEGNLVVFGEGETIDGLRILGSNIVDGTITSVEIGDGSVTNSKLADDSITSGKIKNGEVGSSDLADGAVTSGKISDGTVTASDLSSTLTLSSGDLIDLSAITHSSVSPQGLLLPNASSGSPSSPSTGEGYIAYDTSGNQVIVYNGSSWAVVGNGDITEVAAGNGLSGGGTSGSVTLTVDATTSGTAAGTSSNSGLVVASDGVSLLRGCSNGEILKWNSSTVVWECSTDGGGGGGGSIDVQEGDTTVTSTASTIDFLAADFAVTNSPSGEANISIDYSNSKIVRSDQNESVTGAWTFSTNISVTGTATTGALVVGGDTISEFAGTGLQVSGNTLSSTLGTSISNAELDNSTITFAGDSGSSTTALGATRTLSGGTNGVDTSDNGSGTLVISLDTTEVGSTTFGSGSGITWTLDASGGTDTSITFGSNQQIFTSGTASFSNRLGIGTTSPTVALDVVGAGNFTTNVTATGSVSTATLTVSGNAIVTGSVSSGTLTVGGDTISEFAGTGLQVSGNTLSSTLGTSISNAELDNSTITFAGDSGSSTTALGATRTLSGGTNGVDTSDNGSGTLVISLDTTEVGSTTFGSGSGITWTLDASGGTDTSITFGSNQQIFTSGTASFSNRLGIGTTAPTVALDVVGAGNFTTNVTATGSVSTATLTVSGNAIVTGSVSSGTLTVGGDTISEFAGTGLQVSGNTLSSTLGTSISNAELDNSTITFAGDSGSSTTALGATRTISGGTNGVDTSDNGAGTLVINLDTTEIGSTTFGSGSGITWTFDAGATDPTITFGSASTIFTSGTASFSNRLGIGTTSPTVALDVVGAGNFSTNVTATGSVSTATLTVSGDAIVTGSVSTGSLTVGGDTISEFAGTGLQVTGNTLSSTLGTSISNAELDNSTITFAGDSGSSTTALGATRTISGGTNGVDTSDNGAGTLVINLDTTEVGTSTFGSGSGITWTFDAGATDPTITFGSNQQIFTSGTASFSGNLGIGTTAPTVALDVVGAGLFSTDLTINGNTTLGDATTDTVTLNGIPTFNAAAATFTVDTDVTLSGGVNGLSFDTSTLSIDATSDFVGIGTTAPANKLSVAGIVAPTLDDTYSLGTDGLRWSDVYVGPSTVHIGTSTSDEGTLAYNTTTNTLSQSSTGGISFTAGSTGDYVFNTDSDSFVGIGTTAPGAQLEVSGSSGNELIRLTNTTSADSSGIFSGAGSPEGVVTAQIGSIYADTTYGKVYKKGSGDGTNTGWEEFAAGSGWNGAKMSSTIVQNIAHNTEVKVLFNAEDFDSGDIADTTTDRFTIKKAGTYLVTAGVCIANVDDAEAVYVHIRKNGTVYTLKYNYTSLANGGGTASVTTTLSLAVNDYIEMYTGHTEGAAQDTCSAPNLPEMSVVQLDAAGGGQPEVGARVYNSGAQTISTEANTALTMNSERYDTSAIHSTSSNTSRLTIPIAGKYLVGGSIVYAVNGTGQRELLVKLNGTTHIASQGSPGSTTNWNRLDVSTVYQFSAGDYVELTTYQNSGGNLDTVITENAGSEFYIAKIDGGVNSTLQAAFNSGNTVTTTDGRNIQFTLADTTTDQTIEITQAGTALAFRVNDDGTFTDSTPFVIDASGNVGIGTTAPGYLLEVNGTARINGNTTLGDSTADTVTFNAGKSGTGISFADSSFTTCTALATVGGVLTCGAGGSGVWTDGTAAAYLADSSDRVGIGTSTTTDKLNILTSAGGSASFDGLQIDFTQSDDSDSADTNALLNLIATSSSSDPDTLLGINIAAITGGSANEYGLQIGTGWDYAILSGGIIAPSTNDTYSFGTNALRWSDIYVGPSTVHIGTSTSDEGTLAYNTTTNNLKIGATNGVLIQNTADSTTAFQLQNSAGTSNLLVGDTTNNKIGVAGTPTSSGATIQVTGNASATTGFDLAATGNSSSSITKSTVVSTAVNANDVVVIDTTNAGQVKTTTVGGSTGVFGIATTTQSSSAQTQNIVIGGIYQVTADTTAVSIGDQLVTSTTAGYVTPSSSPSIGTSIGRALSAKAAGSSGTVWVQVNPGSGGAAINDGSAVGSITVYSGATAPSGWLFAYGQAVSRTTYSDLFTAISTTYGTGDGSTTFNLPDYRGRNPIGLDNMGGSDAGRLNTANTLGGTGGEQLHTLTIAEMPSHVHTDGSIYADENIWGSGAIANRSVNVNYTGQNNTSATGGDGSHNVMDPYLLTNFIIKATNNTGNSANGNGPQSAKMTNSNQSIPNDTVTKIVFDSEDYDIGDIADFTTNDRFNIRKSGKYLITAKLYLAGADAGEYRNVYIYKNGSYTEFARDRSGVTDNDGTVGLVNTYDLVAGDYIEMYAYHNEGGTLFTGTGLNVTNMSVVQLDTTGNATTLQGAYDMGRSVTTTDGRNIQFTLADTTTDQTFELTQAGTALAFRVNDDGTFTDPTAFVVDATGNVGIGTTAPSSALNVVGTTGITWTGGGTSSGLVTIGTQGTSGSSLFINTPSLNSTYASGLAVDGSYTNPGGIGTSVINLKALGVNSGGGYDSALTFYTASGVTSSEKMRITAAGNVGIGTTAPASKLHVVSDVAASQDHAFRFLNPSQGNSQYLYLTVGKSTASDQSAAFGFTQESANSRAFMGVIGDDVSGGVGLIVKKGGNVGIGTNNPGTKLEVAGQVTISGGSLMYFPNCGVNICTITEGWGFRFNSDGTHPLQATQSLLVGLTASGGNYGTGNVRIGGYMYWDKSQDQCLGPGGGDDNWLRLTADQCTYAQAYTDLALDNLWAAGAQRFDIAEYTPVKESDNLIPGDIVSSDPDADTQLSRSQVAYDRTVFGIVSSIHSAAMVIGGKGPEQYTQFGDKSELPIALGGRVMVKVSSENGLIERGDAITTSTIPGTGMKIDKAGPIIGKSMDKFDPSQLTCTPTATAQSAPWREFEDPGINPDGIPKNECFVLPDGTYLTRLTVFVTPSWYDPSEDTEARLSALITDLCKNELGSGMNSISGCPEVAGASVNLDEIGFGESELASSSAVLGESTATTIVQDYIYKGLVEFWNKVTFKEVVEFWSEAIFKNKVRFLAQVEFNKDTAGYAIVKRGERMVDVVFEQAFENEPVVNTSVSIPVITQAKFEELIVSGDCDIQGGLSACQDKIVSEILADDFKAVITAKSVNGFTILLSHSAVVDTTFSWQAIAVKDVKTSSSKTTAELLGIATSSANLSTTPTPAPVAQSLQVQSSLGFVRLRESSTVESAELAQIPTDTTLSYTSEENGWYEVSYEGQTGWVSGEYVVLSSSVTPTPSATLTATPTPTPVTISGKTVTVLTNDLGFVRLRSQSNTEGEDLAHIPVDTVLTFTETEFGWYKVKYEGIEGWVSGAYVQEND